MQKILFVVPLYDSIGPRSIRFKNIIDRLNEIPDRKYSINILKFKIRSIDKNPKAGEINIKLPKFISKLLFSNSLTNKILSLIIKPDIRLLTLPFLVSNLNELNSKKGTFDLIVFTRPFSYYLGGYLVKRKLKANKMVTVLDMGDPYFNNSASSNNFIKKKFEAFCLKYYDFIIVTNNLTKKLLIDVYGIEESKIRIIPQGSVIPSKNKAVTIGEKNKNEIAFTYAGAFYSKLRDPQVFIEVINEINNPKIKINFIGVPKAWSYGSYYVTHFPRMENDRVIEEYEKSDILLFFDNNFGIQTSGKIFELLAISKPLLIITNEERKILFDDFKNFEGVYIVNYDKDDLKSIINDLITKETISNRELVGEMFSWNTRAKAYNDFINENI